MIDPFLLDGIARTMADVADWITRCGWEAAKQRHIRELKEGRAGDADVEYLLHSAEKIARAVIRSERRSLLALLRSMTGTTDGLRIALEAWEKRQGGTR